MPEAKTKLRSPDTRRIGLSQLHEIAYWTRRFEVGVDELRAAVKQVGDRPSAVRRYFTQQRKARIERAPSSSP